jgi:hypothetical protein
MPVARIPPAAKTLPAKPTRHVRFVPADILRRSKIVLLTRSAACGARKGSLDFRHPHLGFNRVGNETILMGGVMHPIKLFRIGLSAVAPRNLWA